MCHDVGHQGLGGLFTQVALDRGNFGGGMARKGGAPDPGNVNRTWLRLRRRAHAAGVRPLKPHSARHSWATFALRAHKSPRWVCDQLGHADPAITMRVYAHAMPREESDLSFAEFGGDAKRRHTALETESEIGDSPNYANSMARREGFEPPPLRFEA